MTSHELAQKLLALPEQPVLLWVDGVGQVLDSFGDWEQVQNFTVGDQGIKLSEVGHDD